MKRTRLSILFGALMLSLTLLVTACAAPTDDGEKMEEMGEKEKVEEVSLPDVNTKASELRATLVHLQTRHVDYASAAVRKVATNADDLSAAVDVLTQNTNEITKAISDIVGAETGEVFKGLWESHVGFFVDYTKAVVAGDDDAQAKAVENLKGYAEGTAQFMTAIGLPEKVVYDRVWKHVLLLKEAVDDFAAGDLAGSYDAQDRAGKQIAEEISVVVADGLAKTFPDKFRD